MPSIPWKFNLRGTTSKFYLELASMEGSGRNNEKWREEKPKLWWWWKAWGYHEGSKKCNATSRLDKPHIHNKHIKSNLFDCCQPPVGALLEVDLHLTKGKQCYSVLFPPFIHLYIEWSKTLYHTPFSCGNQTCIIIVLILTQGLYNSWMYKVDFCE